MTFLGHTCICMLILPGQVTFVFFKCDLVLLSLIVFLVSRNAQTIEIVSRWHSEV